MIPTFKIASYNLIKWQQANDTVISPCPLCSWMYWGLDGTRIANLARKAVTKNTKGDWRRPPNEADLGVEHQHIPE